MKKMLALYCLILFLFAACHSKSPLNINELTADNYHEKLELCFDFGSTRDFGVSQFKPWQPYFYYADQLRDGGQLQPRNDFIIKATYRKDGKVIDITQYSPLIYFKFDYRNDNLASINIETSVFKHDDELEYGKELVEYLLREQQYVYKKSNYKGGVDLLMKQIGNHVLTCAIMGTDDVIGALIFQVWKEK